MLVALEPGDARLDVEGEGEGEGEAARRWASLCAAPAAPPAPDVLAQDPLDDEETRDAWPPAPRVPPPTLDVLAFSPRAAPHPPVPHPATVALVLHNR